MGECATTRDNRPFGLACYLLLALEKALLDRSIGGHWALVDHTQEVCFPHKGPTEGVQVYHIWILYRFSHCVAAYVRDAKWIGAVGLSCQPKQYRRFR